MESRIEEVTARHKKGYSCSQAVACAYHDLIGMDEETVFKLAEGVSFGLGNMEGACGAVVAACMIAGAKNSTAEMGGAGSKAATMKIAKEIVNKFQEENGTIICKELKGVTTNRPVKPCPECVRDAARILEEVVFGVEH